MAGTYRSLTKKLGVRDGQTVVLLGAPERWCVRFEAEVEALLSEVRVARQLRPAFDTVVMFVDKLADLEDRICPVTERLPPDGQIWVAWRTRRPADVCEEVVRRIGLTAGMSVNGASAIDAVWTGLRLIVRPENRDALAYRLVAHPRRSRRATRPPQLSGAGSGLATARARRRS
jgi:hypothetical protein